SPKWKDYEFFRPIHHHHLSEARSSKPTVRHLTTIRAGEPGVYHVQVSIGINGGMASFKARLSKAHLSQRLAVGRRTGTLAMLVPVARRGRRVLHGSGSRELP